MASGNVTVSFIFETEQSRWTMDVIKYFRLGFTVVTFQGFVGDKDHDDH